MAFFRDILLGLKGPGQFSNVAFKVRSKRFNPDDLNVNLKGKSYLITGANGAIGSIVTTEIAKRGGEVHMVCRNKESASKVQYGIIRKTGNKNIHLHVLDLAESRKVYNFAKAFRESCKNLDALVHVAGIRLPERIENADGIEHTFAVNSLAPHILTRFLSPLLLNSFKGRILFTSSFSMYLSTLNAKDPQLQKVNYNSKRVYSQTKRQLVDLASHYAEEYLDIFSASCNPGWVASPFSAKIDVHPEVRKMWRSPEEAADCLLWLSISDTAFNHSSGSFFIDRQPCSKYLPLTWIGITTIKSRQKFVSYMDQLLKKFEN